jgi:hypothetical protein
MLYTQKMSGHSLHEDFDRRQEGHGSSDRGFGIVISISFALVGLLPLRANHPVRWWALALGGLFLIVAFLQPVWLRRLNRVWTKLGLLMGRVISPVVTACCSISWSRPQDSFFAYWGKTHCVWPWMPELGVTGLNAGRRGRYPKPCRISFRR